METNARPSEFIPEPLPEDACPGWPVAWAPGAVPGTETGDSIVFGLYAFNESTGETLLFRPSPNKFYVRDIRLLARDPWLNYTSYNTGIPSSGFLPPMVPPQEYVGAWTPGPEPQQAEPEPQIDGLNGALLNLMRRESSAGSSAGSSRSDDDVDEQ